MRTHRAPVAALLSALLIVTLCNLAGATMTIAAYAPQNHDRFYSGADRNFIAEGYDLSGVGKSSGGQWGTMISDSYFLSAYHWHPTGSLTFYSTNTTGSAQTYSIASGVRIEGTDLWLGRLATPLDPADSIAWYSTEAYTGNAGDYVGQTVYNYGQPHRVGRNEVSSIRSSTDGTSSSLSLRMDYNDPGVGADETLYRGGDSGGPSFLAFGDELLLWGIHWYASSTYSGDSFLPAYTDAINLAMQDASLSLVTRVDTPPPPPADGGGTDTGGTTGKGGKKDTPNKGRGKGTKLTGKAAVTGAADVPEPTTLVLLLAASAAAIVRKRRRN